jgi:3-phenylpropionate/cinnamic acid dioxygenase small subunit
MPAERNGRVDAELQREIEQFLYEEAELLDDRRLHDWLALLADDIRYRMPTRDNRVRREQGKEFSGETEMAYFDDDKRTLVQRVKRLDTGTAWAEDPPSRTRHLVTNVRIEPLAETGEYAVRSCFVLYRTRLRTDENLFVGRRNDVLRRTAGGWRIARREIVLDQNVIMAKNLSVFF